MMQNQPPQPTPEPTPQGGAAGFPAGKADPRMMELFDKAVDFTRELLAEGAPTVLAAMKNDPVGASVQFGVRALRQVVGAAEQAGYPLPPEVVLAAGVQVIKDLAAAAESNGLLADGEEETFLREALQQSIALFAQLDRDEGRVSDEDMAALAEAGMSGGATAPAQGAPAPRQPGGGALMGALGLA